MLTFQVISAKADSYAPDKYWTSKTNQRGVTQKQHEVELMFLCTAHRLMEKHIKF